jgi:hypothetical protein
VETLQSFLDDAWDALPDTANVLRDQLRSFEKNVTPLFSQGSISSVSKNSASQTYRGPGLGSYTPIQIANAWRTLINLYDATLQKANWAFTQNIPWFLQTYPAFSQAAGTDNDPTVYAMMKWILVPTTEYRIDITDLRLEPTGVGAINGGAYCW